MYNNIYCCICHVYYQVIFFCGSLNIKKKKKTGSIYRYLLTFSVFITGKICPIHVYIVDSFR